jgi:hypothetical protein
MTKALKNWIKRYGPIALTAAALGGLFGDKLLFHTPPVDAEPYHQAVITASDVTPFRVGQWLGKEATIPPAAAQLLHPNLMISRQYHNIQTGESMSFFIVQVRDVRDILGHYPPVCYPGRGWAQRSADPVDWEAGDAVVHGTEYVFSSGQIRESQIVVDHLVILPDGKTYRNMDDATVAARDYRRKYFGAAQIQMVYDASIPAARRAEISAMFLAANRPLIDTIGCKASVEKEYASTIH